jgi:hypothetical protein
MVSITPVQVIGGGIIGGTGPVRIDTRKKTLPEFQISDSPYRVNTWVNITLTVSDNSTWMMWLNLLNGTAEREQINRTWYTSGIWVNPSTNRATVFINITGPPEAKVVTLDARRAEFYVVFNNIASGFS